MSRWQNRRIQPASEGGARSLLCDAGLTHEVEKACELVRVAEKRNPYSDGKSVERRHLATRVEQSRVHCRFGRTDQIEFA